MDALPGVLAVGHVAVLALDAARHVRAEQPLAVGVEQRPAGDRDPRRQLVARQAQVGALVDRQLAARVAGRGEQRRGQAARPEPGPAAQVARGAGQALALERGVERGVGGVAAIGRVAAALRGAHAILLLAERRVAAQARLGGGAVEAVGLREQPRRAGGGVDRALPLLHLRGVAAAAAQRRQRRLGRRQARRRRALHRHDVAERQAVGIVGGARAIAAGGRAVGAIARDHRRRQRRQPGARRGEAQHVRGQIAGVAIVDRERRHRGAADAVAQRRDHRARAIGAGATDAVADQIARRRRRAVGARLQRPVAAAAGAVAARAAELVEQRGAAGGVAGAPAAAAADRRAGRGRIVRQLRQRQHDVDQRVLVGGAQHRAEGRHRARRAPADGRAQIVAGRPGRVARRDPLERAGGEIARRRIEPGRGRAAAVTGDAVAGEAQPVVQRGAIRRRGRRGRGERDEHEEADGGRGPAHPRKLPDPDAVRQRAVTNS